MLIPRVNSGTAGGSLAWRHDCDRLLVHPPPGARRAAGHRPGVLPGGLVPRARLRRRCRPTGAGGRLRRGPDRRELPCLVTRRPLGDGPRAARRRRGVAGLPPRPGRRELAVGRRRRRALGRRRPRVGRPLRPVAAGCPTRPGAASCRSSRGPRWPTPSVLVPAGPVTIETVAVTRGRVWVVDLDGGPSGVRAFAHNGTPLPEVELPAVCSSSSRWCGSATTSWAGRWRPTCRRGPGGCTRTTTWSLVVPPWTPRHRCRSRVARSSGSSPRPRTAPRCRSTSSTAPARPGRHRARPAVRHTAATAISPQAVVPARLAARGWSRAGCWRSPTSAAAASTAGSGTTPAGSTPSRTASTTSSPAPTTSSRRGVTSRDRLAIMGGSNGGLLMGAVLTQRPDLARAVVARCR